MREGLFIKKNIDKWKDYQYDATDNPDEMASRFTELVNDLGYSKTFYPHSRVTQYLNGLSSRIYLGIYRNKKEESSRIVTFWKTELPLVIRRHHRQLLYGAVIFFMFLIMGAFSASHDEGFVRGVLSDEYVDMTEDNIAKGDPFGVYKSDNQLSMFLSIAINNIQVSFFIFVVGIFLSVGSIWRLFTEGVRLGAFHYFFFARGLGLKSILVVWIHGTLEISSIIIAGAAGLVLGNSILFPGTHGRLYSLKKGGKDGVKMVIGLVPVFTVAAFLEGFITRYSSMPVWLSIFILAGSLFFVIWYFVVYPIQLEKKMRSLPIPEL